MNTVRKEEYASNSSLLEMSNANEIARKKNARTANFILALLVVSTVFFAVFR